MYVFLNFKKLILHFKLMRSRIPLIIAFILPFFNGFGQFLYIYDQSPVVSDGDKLTMPWAGGLNSAQYGTLDFDLDGRDDLVVFDRTAYKLSAFRNMGDRFEYSPDHERLFPRDIQGWILFLDYDCDGKKDIFTSTLFGIKVYRNVSDDNGLKWELVADPIYSEGTSGNVNLQVNITDIPGIADLDGDNDLDILVYNFATGGAIRHHKNMSVENTGECGLDFVRATMEWGRFEECTCDTFAFGGASCAEIEGRIKHAGGKSMLLIDIDGDVDKELIMSQEDCDKLYFLENKGNIENALMTDFDMQFPNSLAPAHMKYFPAAFYEDVTFDGIPDLIVSPNLSLDPLNRVNFGESSWLYRNIGSKNSPQFDFIKKDFLQEQMIDVGSLATAAFADVDQDGDLDMLLAGNGLEINSKFYGSISFYENTGSAHEPVFVKIANDYLELSNHKWFDIKPAFADLNRDGALDLAIAARTESPSRPVVFYMINQNRSGPYHFETSDIRELNIPYSNGDNISFHDIDGDGFMDILLGKPTGRVEYYRGGSNAYTLSSTAFAGIMDNFLRRSPSLAIADLDGDNEDELAIIDNSGTLRIIKNLRSEVPVEHTLFLSHPLEGEVDSTRFGMNNHLSVTRLYATELPILAIGSVQGGVYLLRNAEGESHTTKINIEIWPNPAPLLSPFYATVSEDAIMEIYSLLGQKLWGERVLKDKVYMPAVHLRPGIYIIRATASNKKSHAVRLVIY